MITKNTVVLKKIMPHLTKEKIETLLNAVDRSHDHLIGLTKSISWTHKEYISKAPLFKENEWQHYESTIYEQCSNISSILNEIESSLVSLKKDHEFKVLYENRDISGSFKAWKLYAENTITVIDLRKQLAFAPSSNAVDPLENKMKECRHYLELVIARFPNTGNYFLIPTTIVLQHQALLQLHVYCNNYTKLLNSLYLTAKQQGQWHEANQFIDKLYAHFQNQLKDTKRYEPDDKGKIACIEQVLIDTGYEKSKLSYLERHKKHLISSQPDVVDGMAARLASLNLVNKQNSAQSNLWHS